MLICQSRGSAGYAYLPLIATLGKSNEDTMSILDEFGAEFYMGDADTIGTACAAWRWRELRNRSVSDAVVLFPTCVHSLDVLHLSTAVAEVTGIPEVPIGEELTEVAGDEGLWAAQVLPEVWLSSIANIPEEQIVAACCRWAHIVRDEYEIEEEWDVPAVTEAFR